MNKVYFLIVLVVIAFLVIYFDRNKICFEDNCFRIEIAQTQEERKKGLMFRDSLDPQKGMLFVFKEEGLYSFWMKNTLIPLDIIWIDEDKKVVDIKENAQPCREEKCESFSPKEEARYVLELNAGEVRDIGLELGDKIIMSDCY